MSALVEPATKIHVLNTRPAPMGEELDATLSKANLSSIYIPGVGIELTHEQNIDLQILRCLRTKFIFVSRNAVDAFYQIIKSDRELFSLAQKHKQLFAVGEGTASQLAQKLNRNIDSIYYPKQSDSEGLLALPQLSNEQMDMSSDNREEQAVDSERVIIVKGDNGRELIKSSLLKRGYTVSEWSLYKRIQNTFSTISNQWQQISILLATSVDIAEAIVLALITNYNEHHTDNLSLSRNEFLNRWQWLVFSQRIKLYLLAQGIDDSQIYICEQMNNSSIINSIQRLAK